MPKPNALNVLLSITNFLGCRYTVKPGDSETISFSFREKPGRDKYKIATITTNKHLYSLTPDEAVRYVKSLTVTDLCPS